MKLICLNLWGGRIYQPLAKFLKEHSSETDIFCFQEIYHHAEDGMSDELRKHRPNLFADIQQLLPDHKAYFRPVIRGVYGIAIFVKKGILVLEEGEIDIFRNQNYPGHGGSHSRNLQWIRVKVNDKMYSIMNVHGLHTGSGKEDTPERLLQSKRIKDFMLRISGMKILCGDFNLLPETESLKLLEDQMINLVKKYEIKSTRSHYYTKEVKFADYVLVSSDVDVRQFEVLQESVSDHLPLLLEFD